MSILYLHIGSTKTGTSTLQTFLSEKRALLLDHGIIYPRAGVDKISHLPFFEAIFESATSGVPGSSQRLNRIVTRIIDEYRSEDAKFLLLSCERFFANSTPNIVKKVMQSFGDFKIKIVVYLRRQDIWLQSIYKEQMKAPNPNMRYRIKRFLDTDYAKQAADYHTLISHWADLIGKENIIVKIYERGQIDGNLVSDFLSVLNISDVFIEDVKSTNIGLTPYQTEALRLSKFFDIPLTERETLHRWLYSNFISQFDPEFFQAYSLIPFNKAKMILSNFKEGNSLIAKEYLGRPDGQLFYEPLQESSDQEEGLCLHPEQFSKFSHSKMLSFVLYLLMHANQMNVNNNIQISRRLDRIEDKLEKLLDLIIKNN